MELGRDDLLAMYRWMYLTRTLDLRVCELSKERTVHELLHASTGQEAVGVGACYGLKPDDIVSPALRSRAARLVRGITPRETMAAMLGKAAGGVTKGKLFSRHLGDLKLGVLPCTAIVGSMLAVATGAGLGCKMAGKSQVVVAFFGDGAANAGVFHESLNCAALQQLPVIYICENNHYAVSTHYTRSTAGGSVAARAAGYGIPGKEVDGNDVLAVYAATQEAAARARAGEGPSLLECKTYRMRGHHERMSPREHRPPGEYDLWQERCPIQRLKAYLLAESLVSEEEIARLESWVLAEVEDAVQFAIESPFPAPEELFADVYAPGYTPANWGGRP